MEKMIGHIFGSLERHERMFRDVRRAFRHMDGRINKISLATMLTGACILMQQAQINELRSRLDQKKDEGMG